MSLSVAGEPPVLKGREGKFRDVGLKDPTLSGTKNDNQSMFTFWNLVTMDRENFHFKQMSG